jgi:hypothetical protein
MSLVDPPRQDIPKAIQDDPEFSDWMKTNNKFLHDLWLRTGGFDDAIEQVVDVVTGDPDAVIPGSGGTTVGQTPTDDWIRWAVN